MKHQLFLAADCANISQEGTLNIMGVFRVINSPKFPARHPAIHLVVNLEAELGEYGDERTLNILLHDPDGVEMMSLALPIKIPEIKDGMIPEVNSIFNLRDIVFQKPGPYRFVVMVDRDHKGDLTIRVNKIDISAPPGG